MSKFKPGDVVILVNHSDDSHINLELGYEGIVESVFIPRRNSSMPRVLVKWKQHGEHGSIWYVNENIIELTGFTLENE